MTRWHSTSPMGSVTCVLGAWYAPCGGVAPGTVGVHGACLGAAAMVTPSLMVPGMVHSPHAWSDSIQVSATASVPQNVRSGFSET